MGPNDRFGSKMRRTRIEHILSALPPLATEERTFGIGSSVPLADMVESRDFEDNHLSRCDHRKAIGPSRTPAASSANKATRCRGDPVGSAPLDVDVSACPCWGTTLQGVKCNA